MYLYVIRRITSKNYSTIDSPSLYPSYSPHVTRHPKSRTWELFSLRSMRPAAFPSLLLLLYSLSFSSLSGKLRQNLGDNRHLESSLLLSYRVTHIPREPEEKIGHQRNFTSGDTSFPLGLLFRFRSSFSLDVKVSYVYHGGIISLIINS